MSGPVIVFDSGMGGLTVLAAIRHQALALDCLYIADDAGFPYGARAEGDLVDRVVALMERLVAEHGPAAVVIACNTASTLVLGPLRGRFDVPFIGTVPAVKPAAAASRSGLIGVLATAATVKRDYTRALIAEFAANAEVTLVAAPGLAGLAEEKIAGRPVDNASLAREIAPAFVEAGGRRTDVVVLACTHFPLLMDELAAAAPWPVEWIDPAPAIARRVIDVLGGPGATGGAGRTDFELTSGGVLPSGAPAMLAGLIDSAGTGR